MNRAEIEVIYQTLFERTATAVRQGVEIRPILVRTDTMDSFPLENVPKPIWPKFQQMFAEDMKEGFCAFICEAWVAIQNHPTYDPDTDLLPSERPDRTECVVFSFVSKDWQAMAFCRINRRGKRPKLEPHKLEFVGDPKSGFQAKGRFIIDQPTKH